MNTSEGSQWKYCYPPYFTDREVQSTCKSGTCGKALLYPTACPCWQGDAPQFPKWEQLWGPLFWWRTGGKQLSLIFYREMMDSWSSEHIQRVLSLILEPDGDSEILNLSFLLRNLCPDHVMVPELSGLVKESCKYLFSPSLFLWCAFYSLVFPQPFSGTFFLSPPGRRERINTKTQLSKVFRAGLQVLLAWPEIAPSPKTRSKGKCWEIQMYSLFSDNLTPQQPAALQPTLSTQSRRHIPHWQAGSEIATLYREWVFIGERNSSSELSRDVKALHFPEAKFNLWLFSFCFFGWGSFF